MAELVEEFDVENVTRYKCQMRGCPIVSTIESPVCESHLTQIGRVYLETRSVAGSFLALREHLQHKSTLAQADLDSELRLQSAAGHPFPSSVYYVRLGSHVKIGTTCDLPARLRALYADHDPDLLLAVEPGDQRVEARRHREFKDERVFANRELFNPSRRLLAHIQEVKGAHGLPVLVR